MVLTWTTQREASFQDGCLSVRKAVLDKIRESSAPGPIYNPKPRVLSTEKSLRDIKFGTGPARQNDPPEKTKRRVPQNSHQPGPNTYDPEKILANLKSIPGIKFGTGSRFGSASSSGNESKSKLPQSSQSAPSPAEYDPEMIRRGIMFSKSGTSFFKFGTAKKDKQLNQMEIAHTPGPQTYDPEAIKRGVMFTKSTMTSVKFGDPPRKKKKSSSNLKNKRPSTASSQKSSGSMFDDGHPSSLSSPGPQDYDTDKIRNAVSSCLSTKKRPPGVIFTTGPRTYNDAEERERASKPGPASYPIPSTMGPQFNSKYKSQPTISFGAR